ncbi:hypothetical protein EVAR_19967_1 [Eumeta japonica]|uniref:Uncharacterized protein n=1 Tax=Eumeta variegata TaxID=151549 RepID=A0A4C1VAZ1_EUMVA|nr:hypothetical protein EVAR_19967_1 [Eumeta japonica]
MNPNRYKVWVVETQKFVKVREVVVDEMNFLSSRPTLKSERIIYKNSYEDNSNVHTSSSKKLCKSGDLKSDVQKQTNDAFIKNTSLGQLPNKSVTETDMHDRPSSMQNNETFPNLKRSDRIKTRPNNFL